MILAEAGDPRRYETSSSLVKHAGLSPADNASGASEGQSHISRRGRPALRTAAWRAVWPLPRPRAPQTLPACGLSVAG